MKSKKSLEVGKSYIKIGLVFTIKNLLYTQILQHLYDPNISNFQFQLFIFGKLVGGLDAISQWQILLVNLITPIVIQNSWKTIKQDADKEDKNEHVNINLKRYIILVLKVNFWSIAVFFVLDLLLFYVSFEGGYNAFYDFCTFICIIVGFLICKEMLGTSDNSLDLSNISEVISRGSNNKTSQRLALSYADYGEFSPWWLTGYIDGDGCFTWTIYKSKNHKFGYKIGIFFKLVMKRIPSNLALMERLVVLFGGTIGDNCGNLQWVIADVATLEKLRNHFLKYPLQTSKKIHFKAWSKVLDILIKNQHFNLKGLHESVALKGFSPEGISEKLKSEFPNVKIKKYPVFIPSTAPLDPNWVAGFTNADGGFSQGARTRKDSILVAFDPVVHITQHERDLTVLERILLVFGKGKIYTSKSDRYRIHITGYKNIAQNPNSIIEFYNTYPVHGAKAKDFLDFSTGIKLIGEKAHLTKDGNNKLKDLFKGMNSYRNN